MNNDGVRDVLLRWTGREDDRAEENLSDQNRAGQPAPANGTPNLIYWVLSAIWFVGALIYVDAAYGVGSLAFMLPHELAQVVLAIFAPPAFGWLLLLVGRRSGETRDSRAALLEILADVSGPDAEAEARLNATAMALRRVSQTVEGELNNALERASALDERVEAAVQRLGMLGEGVTRQSTDLSELIDRSHTSQRDLLGELRQLGEQTRELGRADAGALDTAVEAALRRTEEISTLLDQKARTMSETVDLVARRATEISSAIDLPMNRLREESDQTVRRIQGASQELKGRVEGLAQEMTRTVEQAGGASKGIDDSTQRLRGASNEVRVLLSGLGDAVGSQTERLNDLIGGTVKSSDQAVARMDARLSQLAAALDNLNVGAGDAEEGLLSAGDRLKQALDQFTEHAQQASEAASESAHRTDNAATTMMEAGAAIGATGKQITSANQSLAQLRDDVSATLAHLNGVVAENMDNVQERMRETASFAESAAERSGEKLARIGLDVIDQSRKLERQLVLLEEQAGQSSASGSSAADVLALRLADMRTMIEALRAEATRGTGALKDLTVAGEAATVQTAGHANLLDQAATSLSTRIDDAREAVDTASQAMLNQADAVENRVNLASENMASRVERFDLLNRQLATSVAQSDREIADRLQQMAEKVTAAAEGYELRLAATSETFGASLDRFEVRSAELEKAAETSAARVSASTGTMAEVAAELSLLLKDIEAASTSAGGEIAGMEQQIATLTAHLRGDVDQSLAMLEERSGEVASRLSRGAGELIAAADQVELHGDRSLDRLEQARTAAFNGIGEAEGELQRLSDGWQARVTGFETMADQLRSVEVTLDRDTAERLSGLAGQIIEASQSANVAVGDLKQQQQLLSGLGDQVGERLGGVVAEMELRLSALVAQSQGAASDLSARLGLLSDEVAALDDASSRTADNAASQQQRVAHLVSDLNELSQGLTARVSDLATAASGASEQLLGETGRLDEKSVHLRAELANASQSLADEGARLTTMLDSLVTGSARADSELKASLSGMAATVRGATDLAQMTTDTLIAGSGALTEEAESVRLRIVGLTEEMRAELRKLEQTSQVTAEQVTGAAGEIELRTSALLAQGSASHADMLGKAEEIARRMNDLTALNEAAQARFETSSRQMGQSAEVSEAQSRSAIAAMQEAVAAIDAALPQAGAAEASARALEAAGKDLRADIRHSAEAGSEIYVRLKDERTQFSAENQRLNEALSGGLSRLNAMLEETRARMGKVSASEAAAAESAERTTQRLDEQLSRSAEIADILGRRGAELDALLQSRIEAVGQAEAQASTFAEDLAVRLAAAEQQLSEMRTRADTDSEQLLESVSRTLDDLKERSDSFTTHLATFDESHVRLRTDISQSIEQVQADVREAAKASEKIAAIADTSTTALNRQREAFAESVEQAELAAQQARKTLGEQATSIASAAQAATMQSGMASRAFEEQADRLEKSAKLAASSAAELAEQTRTGQGRQFLKSAAMVAEGLGSMALDLHRILDGDVTDKAWRTYLKGDRGLFARRLVDRASRRDITHAYETDGEFRQHVDQYLGQFDTILRAAAETDTGDILYGVFLSADIGKLYIVLCDALDRAPVIKGRT